MVAALSAKRFFGNVAHYVRKLLSNCETFRRPLSGRLPDSTRPSPRWKPKCRLQVPFVTKFLNLCAAEVNQFTDRIRKTL